MSDCIFCKIAAHEIPSTVVYEDDAVIAFDDLSPQAPVHTLVVPKTHCVNVLDCPADVMAHVMDTVQKICRHYVENCGYDGVNLANCSGAEAQQSVFHFHMHIIPRKHADGVDMFPGKKKLGQNYEETVKRLALV